MRKILLTIIIILLLSFTGIVIYKGTEIGSFNVWGITQIISENETIDQKNEQLSTLVSVTYPGTLSKLNESAETLEETKSEYENQAVLLADSKYYRQTENYKIEFLWTRIGNYAKDNEVEIKIDVTNSQTNGLYDLNFTVLGHYADVTQFIYDIENDSRLGFKIEDFSMTAGVSATVTTDEGQKTTENYNTVQGKFACKEIRIDLKSLDNSSDTSQGTTTNDNQENSDTMTQNTSTSTNDGTNSNNANTTNNTSASNAAKTTSDSNQEVSSDTANVDDTSTESNPVSNDVTE